MLSNPMDGQNTHVIWPLMSVVIVGALVVLYHFALRPMLASFSANHSAQLDQDQPKENPDTRNTDDGLSSPSTSDSTESSECETKSITSILPCIGTLLGVPPTGNLRPRLKDRNSLTSTPTIRSTIEGKPPTKFIPGTLAALDLSGERQLPIPKKILTRLVINLDGLDGSDGLNRESKSFVHHKYFRTEWQEASSFVRCTKTAGSFLHDYLDDQHSFFVSSFQYRILKQVVPDTSGKWLALRARKMQSGTKPHEIELGSESVQNIGGWKWNLPRMLSGHMNSNPDAKLYLELVLSYTRYTPHPIQNCNGSNCATVIRDSLLRERIELPESCLNHVTGAWFLSGELINQYFTKELIQHLVDQDGALKNDPVWLELSDDKKKDFVNNVHMFCTRLLASSIIAKLDLRYVFYLDRANIKDVKLPLEITAKKLLPFLSPSDASLDFQEFVRYQGSCKAHSFQDPGGSQHKPTNGHTKRTPRVHEHIPNNVVIPILESEALKSGRNAQVYRIRLHGDHHKFSPDRNKFFALKRIVRDSRITDISHESKILAKLSTVPHPHLTPLLASWQQGDSCSILLPLANENLDSLMETIPRPKLDGCFIMWLLRQMTGLAAALDHIHNLGPADLGPEPENKVRDGDRSKSGYHHDLHPANILVFDGDILKISDFGTARIQQALGSGSYVSRRALCNTDYEAPENALSQKASRPHDVWALGCIFLEMLVWASGHSVKEFHNTRSKARETEDEEILVRDASFWCENGHSAELKSAVEHKIRTLKLQHWNKCVFQTLLTLVEHMLRIEIQPDKPDSRILISGACSILQKTISQAELDLGEHGDDFFTKTCPPTSRRTYAPPSEVMKSREPSEMGDRDHGPKDLKHNRLQVPKPKTHSRRRSTGDLLKLEQFPNLSVPTNSSIPRPDPQSDLAHTGGQYTGEADPTSTPQTPILKFTDHDDDEQRFFASGTAITPPYSDGSRGSGSATPQNQLNGGNGYGYGYGYGSSSATMSFREIEELLPQ